MTRPARPIIRPMGQTIEINAARPVGDVLIISTDRSLTGQDAEAYERGGTGDPQTFAEDMAGRLFDADDAVLRVHVLSNSVSILRDGGWPSDTVDSLTDVVARFFRYYPD